MSENCRGFSLSCIIEDESDVDGSDRGVVLGMGVDIFFCLLLL